MSSNRPVFRRRFPPALSGILRLAIGLSALLAFVPVSARAQVPSDSLPGSRQLTVLSTIEEDQLRIEQLQGAAADGFLLRSTSRLSQLQRGSATLSWSLLAPTVRTTWNSDIPYSLNDGSAWSGRGLNLLASAGVGASWGPLTVILAPELAYAENRDFDRVRGEIPNHTEYVLPWFTDTLSVDLPLRPSNESLSRILPGQSSASLTAGPISAGVGTENHWWGPGIRNAIVLSNNATGFAHGFVRTIRPLRTAAGSLEGIWLTGELNASDQFRTADFLEDHPEAVGDRSISGFAATFAPAFEPNLTLGVSRVVYAPRDSSDSRLSHAADVFSDWSAGDATAEDAEDTPSEQIIAAFGRWIFPEEGAEVYAEWARSQLPLSFRDFLAQPNHSQGYTLGFQVLRPFLSAAKLRVQGEATNLERSATYRLRPTGSFYSSLEIPEGYTHEGRVVGASIGPGSSSQWLAVDFIAESYRAGIYGSRVRWNNDAYFRKLSPWPFFGHDVTLLGGIRGGLDLSALRLDADVAYGKRHNFLFQNWGAGWAEAARGVDQPNLTLRLTVTPLLEGLLTR